MNILCPLQGRPAASKELCWETAVRTLSAAISLDWKCQALSLNDIRSLRFGAAWPPMKSCPKWPRCADRRWPELLTPDESSKISNGSRCRCRAAQPPVWSWAVLGSRGAWAAAGRHPGRVPRGVNGHLARRAHVSSSVAVASSQNSFGE